MSTKAAARLASLLSVIVVMLGCSTPRPPAAVVEQVGVLDNINESSDQLSYLLDDGVTWTRPKDQVDVRYDMAGRHTLFVAGPAGGGRWFVYLVGDQDGLPAGCTYALRYGGRDWGDAIEAQGLLWPKAGTFTGLAGAAPSTGGDYPSNAGFCLDDHARVTKVYQAVPPSGAPAPAGSAQG